ncbi:MAG: xanthine dehydrogenase, small subunit [Myxococcaceae bacterium]|nr:xanthine dehydrogenase, small subunit [Myxococcaceae bacterium]
MVRFILNGRPVSVGSVDPHVSLLQWLRSEGLSGSKEGCAEGECGACAVAILRADERGVARYDAVNGCLLPLPSVDGRSIVTVEGVAADDGSLHPVQRAMVERGGSQCGYCTPGFIVSLFCEYYRPDRREYEPESISGNLCRCTGYRPIADVARALPQPHGTDPRLPLLQERVPPLEPLTHVATSVAGARSFLRPTTLAQLFEQWAHAPEASLLGGGTDLMVYANQRGERWPTLIALDAIAELQRFSWEHRELVLGAGLELSALERHLRERPGALPLLESLLPLFSSRLVRNRATLGGSLATASPIGDAAPVLLALDAELTLRSAEGARRIAVSELFRGYRQTQLRARELILSVHIPLPAPPLQRFYKVSKRVLDDISTVAGAFTLELDERNQVRRLRLAYGGIAATPVRATEVEALAHGRPWNADTLEELLRALELVGTPLSDHRGKAAYRRAMIGKLLEKFYFETRPAEVP